MKNSNGANEKKETKLHLMYLSIKWTTKGTVCIHAVKLFGKVQGMARDCLLYRLFEKQPFWGKYWNF